MIVGIKRLVVKVGSSVLTDAKGRLQPERIEQLAEQIAACAGRPCQVLIVSSGAIACGMSRLGLARRPTALAQLQACAAVGQGELIQCYAEAFRRRGITTAQVLLTQDDLAARERFRNAKQTLLTLLHRGVIPVINENDTIAVDEIAFGDNDRLAALIASAVDAQLLVLLSDVDGLLKDGRLIERAESLSRGHLALVQEGARQTTKGGMASKLEAARLTGHHGIPMVIANGARPGVLTDVLEGKPVGTLFVPARDRLGPRKWWIAFSLRQPRGTLVVDAGAAQAVRDQGRSLLPSGVRRVQGRFEAGACVSIADEAGREVARGVSNYSAGDLARICGMKSQEAAQALGRARAEEVVHRDHLVLARELEPAA
ncbi:MAG TPA: glutamate 5-kinase [bacterium]